MSGSYNAEVIQQNRAHILSHYTPEDFVGEIDNLMRGIAGDRTPYMAIKRMVEGGCFLIYTADINDYLASIGFPPSARYDASDSFGFYTHLLARDGSRLYDGIKSGKFRGC